MLKIKNYEVKVDDEDEALVRAWVWHVVPHGNNGKKSVQGHRRSGAKERTYIHRLVLGLNSDDPNVDHINGDTLDNRKSNLRLCTPSQNGGNRGPSKNNTSGFKGVHWAKKDKRWIAIIRFQRKLIRLGIYASPELAANAYDDKALELFGEFAWLNRDHPREA